MLALRQSSLSSSDTVFVSIEKLASISSTSIDLVLRISLKISFSLSIRRFSS